MPTGGFRVRNAECGTNETKANIGPFLSFQTPRSALFLTCSIANLPHSLQFPSFTPDEAAKGWLPGPWQTLTPCTADSFESVGQIILTHLWSIAISSVS